MLFRKFVVAAKKLKVRVLETLTMLNMSFQKFQNSEHPKPGSGPLCPLVPQQNLSLKAKSQNSEHPEPGYGCMVLAHFNP